jgi:hypothetical protein
MGDQYRWPGALRAAFMLLFAGLGWVAIYVGIRALHLF